MTAANPETKYQIKADLGEQCLMITMKGFFSKQDAEYAKTQYWSCYEKNFKGRPFKILCDALEFKPSDKEAQKILNQMSLDTVKKKIVAWAIVSGNALGRSQITRMVGVKNFELFADVGSAVKWLASIPLNT